MTSPKLPTPKYISAALLALSLFFSFGLMCVGARTIYSSDVGIGLVLVVAGAWMFWGSFRLKVSALQTVALASMFLAGGAILDLWIPSPEGALPVAKAAFVAIAGTVFSVGMAWLAIRVLAQKRAT